MGFGGTSGADGIEVGLLDPERLPQYRDIIAVGFGAPAAAHDPLPVVELDRVWAATEGEHVVGGVQAYSSQVTPAGPAAPVPMAAVSDVSVQTTHRRRGLLTRLMAPLLEQAAERGEPVAGLMASEATIYGRFGFGIASRSVAIQVRRERAAMRTPSTAGGRVRFLHDQAERVELLPASWEPYRLATPGELVRSPAWWSVVLGPDAQWIGGGKQFVVVHEPDGGGPPDGHCRYTVEERWGGDGAQFTLRVSEMAAVDPEVEAALWEHCFAVDLVTRIECGRRPELDVLSWRLADARARQVTAVGDNLWIRILDVEAALSARGYGSEGSLVLEVDDPFRPAAGGRFQLDAGPDGATCKRTDATPDLSLGIDVLGALWLGANVPSLLAAAGHVAERSAGALAVADRLLPMPQSPLLQTPF
jgi:predicted acetyltransferase